MSEERFVIDASALLAMLAREPGGDAVATVIATTIISAVNWSEVAQKAAAHGVDARSLREDLDSLGVDIVPFGVDEAEAAADLWHQGAQRLSLADRACLATGRVRRQPVLTADREWSAVDLDVEVQVIR